MVLAGCSGEKQPKIYRGEGCGIKQGLPNGGSGRLV